MEILSTIMIGEGQAAEVWLGLDELNRIVAIKDIKPASRDSATLEHHAASITDLDHLNIVKVYSVDDVKLPSTSTQESGYRRCLIMEYVQGKSWDSFSFSVLNDLQLYRLGMQLIDAVEYLHDKGLVHGDLNPGNIIIEKNINIKLIDLFDLNKMFGEMPKWKSLDIENVLTFTKQLVKCSTLGEDGVEEYESIYDEERLLESIKNAFFDIFTFAREEHFFGESYTTKEQKLRTRVLKFRAESIVDVITFLEKMKSLNLSWFGYRLTMIGAPDVDIELITDRSVDEVRDVMNKLPNGHVMAQTVSTLHYYLPMRDYSL